MPIGITWGLAHWPSLVLISVPLLLVPHWNAKQIKRSRIICVALILILLYGVIEQIPFMLFPKIDLFTAFFFSLIIAPPNYKENPVLTIAKTAILSIATLTGRYHLYSKWQHRTPISIKSDLMHGLYKLKSISVDNGYRKELLFTIELTEFIDPDRVCGSASKMSALLFNTYPFDEGYNKIVDVVFNPEEKDNDLTPYPLGQLEQYEEDGGLQVDCYLKYR